MRNRHDPKVCGANVKGVGDNGTIEVTHSCCNDDGRAGIGGPTGIWFNCCPGSGIFYDVGKTVLARNRQDALINHLGYDVDELAAKVTYMFDSWGGGTFDSYLPELKAKFGVSTVKQLYLAVANSTSHVAISMLSEANRLDKLIFDSARAKGYDTVQMTANGYVGGYWNYEIIDTRPLFEHTYTSAEHTSSYPPQTSAGGSSPGSLSLLLAALCVLVFVFLWG